MKLPFITRSKYEKDMLAKEIELFEQMGDVFSLSMENEDLRESNAALTEELKACWKCINARSNRPQKRAKDGKWCK